MKEPGNRLAKLFLGYASPFAELRRIPIVGDFFSWASRKLLPQDTLVWIQIQRGPAEDLWIRVNPRTAHNVQQNAGELKAQQASETTTVSFARADPSTSPDRGLGHVPADSSSDTIKVEAVFLDRCVSGQKSPDLLT